MSTAKDFRGLIQFAICEEKKAQEMYRELAEQAGDDYAKAILEGLREQEFKHEEKLQALLDSIDPSRA